jgi:cytochrome c biogenesis protein CcmG/thiol:disulfide interchange protein DsbE
MAQEQKTGFFHGWPVYLVLLALIVLLGVVIKNRNEEKRVSFKFLDKEPIEKIIQAANPVEPPVKAVVEQPVQDNSAVAELELLAEAETTEPETPSVSPSEDRNAKLLEIVQQRGTWNPILTSWYGKEASDFSFTDITGVKSKLSDYRGREVIVHYWTTWCPACKTQKPDLIKLRGLVDKTDLKIIAISNEDESKLKKEASRYGINYTLTSIPGRQPAPFSHINAIPASFFIDKQGVIKIIGQGAISLAEMQAVLQVE